MDRVKPRYETIEAIKSVAEKLDLKYDKTSQDWAYEIADLNLIDRYYKVYDSLDNDDEKFVLMQTIIQATNDLIDSTGDFHSWTRLEQILTLDFKIHEYTIDYWSCIDTKNLNDCWVISGEMRELIKRQNGKDIE